MRMVTCNNGHYYDQEKNATCPYCANNSGGMMFKQNRQYSKVEEMKKELLFIKLLHLVMMKKQSIIHRGIKCTCSK